MTKLYSRIANWASIGTELSTATAEGQNVPPAAASVANYRHQGETATEHHTLLAIQNLSNQMSCRYVNTK